MHCQVFYVIENACIKIKISKSWCKLHSPDLLSYYLFLLFDFWRIRNMVVGHLLPWCIFDGVFAIYACFHKGSEALITLSWRTCLCLIVCAGRLNSCMNNRAPLYRPAVTHARLNQINAGSRTARAWNVDHIQTNCRKSVNMTPVVTRSIKPIVSEVSLSVDAGIAYANSSVSEFKCI